MGSVDNMPASIPINARTNDAPPITDALWCHQATLNRIYHSISQPEGCRRIYMYVCIDKIHCRLKWCFVANIHNCFNIHSKIVCQMLTILFQPQCIK